MLSPQFFHYKLYMHQVYTILCLYALCAFATCGGFHVEKGGIINVRELKTYDFNLAYHSLEYLSFLSGL